MDDMTVSRTILEQLGGRRFMVMTGARCLVGGGVTLTMQLPGIARCAGQKISGLRITLEPSDTYKVEAVWFDRTRLQLVVRGEEADVYCDGLQAAFTRLTGLDTSLGR